MHFVLSLRYKLGLIAIAAAINSSVAAADTALTFEQVLESALRESPLLQKIESEIASQEGTGIAIGTLPNPELFAEVRPYVSDTEDQDQEYEVGIEQQLRASNFGARARVAELIRKSGSVERRLKLEEFRQGLLLAYGKTWVLQEKERFTREAQRHADQLLGKMKSAGEQGLVPESTQKLFIAESKRLGAELLGARADKSHSVAELTRRSGAKVSGAELQELTFAPFPQDVKSELTSEMPLSSRLKLRSELGRAQERLARLDAFPKLTPRIAFEHTNDGDDRINVGLSFELPFSDRNQSERIKATAERRALDAELTYLESGHLAEELQLLLDGARISFEQAKAFREGVIPAAHAALAAAERELGAGQGNPLQVWQTLLEVSELQDRYLELFTKALSERVELSVMLGREI